MEFFQSRRYSRHDSWRKSRGHYPRSACESWERFGLCQPRYRTAISGGPRAIPGERQWSELFRFSKIGLAGLEGSLAGRMGEELRNEKRSGPEDIRAVWSSRLVYTDKSTGLLTSPALLVECLLEGRQGHSLGSVAPVRRCSPVDLPWQCCSSLHCCA